MKRAVNGLALELAVALAGAWTGCEAPRAAAVPGSFVPQPAVIPAQPPPAEIVVADVEDTAQVPIEVAPSELEVDAGPPALPMSWARTFGHTQPFAEAIRAARAARSSFEAAAAASLSPVDGGAPPARRFAEANALLDLASRRFAAAYHAPDATEGNQIATLREGAEVLLSWSRRLDELGLARAPASYRTDPSIALTFEDVAVGPAKRWREEGVALVLRCVELGRSPGARAESALRDCAAMRRTYDHVVRRRTAADAGAGRADEGACACDPGDPLCSASMSGWCRPR